MASQGLAQAVSDSVHGGQACFDGAGAGAGTAVHHGALLYDIHGSRLGVPRTYDISVHAGGAYGQGHSNDSSVHAGGRSLNHTMPTGGSVHGGAAWGGGEGSTHGTGAKSFSHTMPGSVHGGAAHGLGHDGSAHGELMNPHPLAYGLAANMRSGAPSMANDGSAHSGAVRAPPHAGSVRNGKGAGAQQQQQQLLHHEGSSHGGGSKGQQAWPVPAPLPVPAVGDGGAGPRVRADLAFDLPGSVRRGSRYITAQASLPGDPHAHAHGVARARGAPLHASSSTLPSGAGGDGTSGLPAMSSGYGGHAGAHANARASSGGSSSSARSVQPGAAAGAGALHHGARGMPGLHAAGAGPSLATAAAAARSGQGQGQGYAGAGASHHGAANTGARGGHAGGARGGQAGAGPAALPMPSTAGGYGYGTKAQLPPVGLGRVASTGGVLEDFD